MEIVQEKPLVLLDCAKDPEAMGRLRNAIRGDLDFENLILVLSISSDKNIDAMVKNIAPISEKIIITAHSVMDRAADPLTIAESVKKYEKEHQIIPDVKDAVKKAIEIAGEKDLVLVTGSLFTVAEARELWHNTEQTWGREFNEIPRK
jgi:dihydrofolate synthase/folylpolyglutamate synthase